MTDSDSMPLPEDPPEDPQPLPTLEIINRLDIGLFVLDKECNVVSWNQFMSLYSGISAKNIIGTCLFDHFPEIPVKWFRKKASSVFLLKSNAFITWDQRQYLFKFRHNRPITGGTEFMAQNVTLTPVKVGKNITHVAVTILDVTDLFISRAKLEKANKMLEELSRIDGLTGVFNRAHLEMILSSEIRRSRRYGNPLSLIMLDIDHFKKVNDTRGHLAGDAVICGLANIISANTREHDCVGRYGGEEFCVILPNLTLEQAIACAEKLRKCVIESPIEYGGDQIAVTCSFGVASLDEGSLTHEQLLDSADSALYLSKDKGRNAVSSSLEKGERNHTPRQ